VRECVWECGVLANVRWEVMIWNDEVEEEHAGKLEWQNCT